MGADVVKKLRFASAVVGVGCLVFLFGIWLPKQCANTKRHLGLDAYIYYTTANLVLMHQSPYDSPKVPLYLTLPTKAHPRGQVRRDPYGPNYTPICYLYSPQFAVIFAPLVILTPHIFGCLWETLLALTLVAYSFILATLLKPAADIHDRAYLSISIFAVVLWSPNILFNIGMGNVDLMLSTLIGFGFLSKRRTEIFSIVGQIKPFALLPLVLDCLRDRRQILRSAVILVAGCIIGAAACGVESFVSWRAVSSNVLGQGTFLPLNWSLSFGLLRLLRWLGIWHYTGGPLAAGPRAYLALAGSLGTLAIVLSTKRMPHQERCAACLFGAVLLSPICWPNYLVVGYIYVALRIRRFLDERSSDASIDNPEMTPASAGATA